MSQSCFRCSQELEDHDKFCTHCGAPLKNKCTNNGGIIGDPCQKVNPPQAAYCSACGSPTLFYKTGLVSTPYQGTAQVEIEDLEELQFFTHKFFRDGGA